jgi:uncharacterized protein (DUF58 family)
MHLRQNALLLALLTALVAIVGAWGEDAALAGAWRLPLALLLLGLSYEGWVVARAKLSLKLTSNAHVFLGRPCELQVHLRHQLGRSTLVELAPQAPGVVEIDSAIQSMTIPAEGTAAAFRISARRLGEHVWPALQARIGGPLGLAWWSQRLTTDFKLRVVPELLRGAASSTGAVMAGPRPRSVLGTGSETLQLREYREGDPQNLIDWKATARRGRLVSRDFSEDQHIEIVIALDLGRSSALRAGELDRFGHYANVAARFAEHAARHDDRVGLVTFADRPLVAVAPARGLANVMRIRRILASSALVQTESNPLNAALRIRSLARHRSLVVLLTELDDLTIAGQLVAAARLLLPKHLPLIAGLASGEAEAMRYGEARSWLDPYQALAAQEYCSQLDRSVRALASLGAPALIARPEHLERAVFDAYAEFRRKRRV